MLKLLMDLAQHPTLLYVLTVEQAWMYQRVVEGVFEFDRAWTPQGEGRRLHVHIMEKNDTTDPFWHKHNNAMAVLVLEGDYEVSFGLMPEEYPTVCVSKVRGSEGFGYEMSRSSAHAVRTFSRTMSIYLSGSEADRTSDEPVDLRLDVEHKQKLKAAIHKLIASLKQKAT